MSFKTFFNAHHAPIGAFSSFTFGCKGALGGLGIELKGPANENVYVGVEDRDHPSRYHALPFFGTTAVSDAGAEDYDVEGLSDFQLADRLFPFRDYEVTRTFGPTIDEWRAGDLTFRVLSPVLEVPEPTGEFDEALKQALTPAVLVELTIDNREGKSPRKAFFGYAGSDRSCGMRCWQADGVTAIGQGTTTCVATDDPNVYSGVAWQPEAILDPKHRDNLQFLLGNMAMLVGTVDAGDVKTFRFTVSFFREGTATTGLTTRYYYRQFFDRIEDVARYSLGHFETLAGKARAVNASLGRDLSPERHFMLSHAIRSYFGATQCLQAESGEALWVVNEGEYRMMNTFDLTVDQAFFELALNPWTVRNELDLFVHRYAYYDEVRFPGEEKTYPGGIAFTHDMGIANNFSPAHYSGYEQAGLRGVFSYMSCEELMNWILTAALYYQHTGDDAWVNANHSTFRAVLESMVNRDHPEPEKRNGVMSLDSSRCDGGAEITTYDSLDVSLGQARDNLYLAVKGWACYVLLESIFTRHFEPTLAATARDQAARCAQTVCAAADADGILPALIGGSFAAKIIPAIEGLAYPYLAGIAADSDLLACLSKHFDVVTGSGDCKFGDGGWRLSSTSRNSWLSKIYLCQFVAENVLGRAVDSKADEAHVKWLLDDDNIYFAWSDQMVEGKAAGSRYYPRGVTNVLWMLGAGNTDLASLRTRLLGAAS